jgi:hypothetical protein
MRNITKALRLGLMTLAVLIGGSESAKAQCSIGWSANPVVGYSVDYYFGFFGYTGTSRAVIQQQAISTVPQCVQLGGGWVSYYPLSLIQILPPTPIGGLFYSNFIYQDTGYHPVPYYPYVSGAATSMNGVDITTGQPFYGVGSVTLLVFRIQF